MEFKLCPEQCRKLLRPLYGLCDAGGLWHDTIDHHHRIELGMTPLRINPALYYILTNNILTGLNGAYLDDLIRRGDPSFRNVSERLETSLK